MSSIAKRAIDFYLAHGDVVAESLDDSFGQTHRIHNCPSCASSVVLREGELVELAQVAGAAQGSGLDNAVIPEVVAGAGSREEGELVVC
ncbi:hypothetical protein [Leptolyngbya sp. KIOST-1]|uniref:hypothetical protein n=1 Tax=Leptolyngbya sp. KIOST-1 TaxID=1229172 RepID=UPI0021F0BF3F|nr:hypothetical protein [Leptolyngbya sp. KIOST-1]